MRLSLWGALVECALSSVSPARFAGSSLTYSERLGTKAPGPRGMCAGSYQNEKDMKRVGLQEMGWGKNANADAEFAAGATSTHVDMMADAQKLVRQARRSARAATRPKTGHSFDYWVVKGEIRIHHWYRQRQQPLR
jgi:hypothetical protein